MSKLEMPAVDAVRVKKMARSVQRRHQELGNTVSLNHAYEAVAAMFGYETWSRMKARLEENFVQEVLEQVHGPSGLIPDIPPLQVGSLPFENFVPQDVSPYLVVSGPDDQIRIRILKELIAKWRLQNGSYAPVRIITNGSKPSYLQQLKEMLTPKAQNGTGEVWEVENISPLRSLAFSPFVTSLGDRMPNPQHRIRLINFISTLVIEDEHDRSATERLLGALVDVAYAQRSDRTRSGKPNAFVRGNDSKIDTIVPVDRTDIAWWDVVDMLILRGEHKLAALAQVHAAPNIELLMILLRDAQITSIWQPAKTRSGEGLCDQIARRLSMALREVFSLRHGPNRTINPKNPSVIVQVDGPALAGEFERLANRAFARFSLSGLLLGHEEPNSRTLLVLDGLDEETSQHYMLDLEPIIKGRDRENVHLVSLVRSLEEAKRYNDFSSFLLHSFESREDVNSFRRLLKFSERAFEDAHNYLFAPGRSQDLALGIRRGYRIVDEGMVSVP